MHPAQLQALTMLLNQLAQTSQQQAVTIQHLRQLLGQSTPQPQRPQAPMPQMQPDYMSQQEEAYLGQSIASAAQESAAMDGNQYAAQMAQGIESAIPHFRRARVASQGQRPQQPAAPGLDPFAGMMDVMGGFG